MKNTILTLLLVLGFAMPLLAVDLPFETGKIKPDEMNLASYQEKYPGEPAVILGDAADCRFAYDAKKGFQFEYVRHIRILILNEIGLSYGDFSIPFYETADDKEMIDGFKAWVHNIDDGKVNSTRVRMRDGFERDRANNWKELVFAMPEVRVGSVIDVTYRITSDYMFQLRNWQFQYSIPVVHSEYILNLPSFFVYRARYNGSFNLDKIEQTESIDSWVVPRKMESTMGLVDAGQLRVTAKSTLFRWVAYNVKPLKPEPFMDNVRNYQAHMIFEFTYEQFPNEDPKNFTTTWEDVSKFLEKHEDFGEYLTSSHTVVKELLPADEIPDVGTQIWYALETIADKLTWNNDASATADHSPQWVLEHGTGNSAEINLLLVALLRNMGLKAFPVLATTVDNGRLISDSPTYTQWDYVAAAVETTDEQLIVLDATTLNPIPGFVPQRLINDRGRIMDPKMNNWISLDNNSETTKDVVYDLAMNENGDLTGKVTVKLGGFGRYLYLQREKADDASIFWKGYFSNQNVEITDEKVIYDLTDYEPVELSAQIRIPGFAKKVGDEMTIGSILLEATEDNLLQAPTREYPLIFQNTLVANTVINVDLPEGMKLSFVPDEIYGRWGRWYHKLTVVETENGYQVSWLDNRGTRQIAASNYDGFRSYYSRKIEDNLQVLLIGPKAK